MMSKVGGTYLSQNGGNLERKLSVKKDLILRGDRSKIVTDVLNSKQPRGDR